jgi:transmembrane 9 superfamily member 2/4
MSPVFLPCRILDNLPMVVPIERLDRDAPPFYQQGVHVGVKGHYAGVGSSS